MILFAVGLGLVGLGFIVAGLHDWPVSEDGPDILAEKMRLDGIAKAAANVGDRTAIEIVEKQREILASCTEKVYPDKNDDTCRWKPGGKEEYEKRNF